MSISLTTSLKNEYNTLFNSCIIKEDKRREVENVIQQIWKSKDRYETLSSPLSIPWFVIATIHQLECSGNFDCHLHNGDSLNSRTIQVPKNRPLKGNPPFTWEQSALDALAYTGLTQWKDWTLPGTLYRLELYNGLGSRRHAINTPYLWSYSNHYSSGKYIKDGIWSDVAISKQVGAAVILRRMIEKNLISFSEQSSDNISNGENKIVFDPTLYNKSSEDLQRFLNAHGAKLQVDGKAGQMTSDAFEKIFGYYLKGDPRTIQNGG